jgi:hydroxymethylpyrimidine pyrophosphatase-like HAD family hydrolase
MAGHDIKLILSDIDGTMLPYGAEVIPERTRRALHAALDMGMHVGPASGRGIGHVRPSFGGDDALIATALATNGMQVYLDGELIHEEHLPHEALEHVCQTIDGLQGVGAIVFDKNQPLLVQGVRDDLYESFPTYAREALDSVRIPDFPIVKMNVFVAGCMKYTKKDFDLVRREVSEIDFNVPMAGC